MSEKPDLRLIKGGKPDIPDDFPYELADPPEHGWVPKPKPKIDFDHLRSLGHVAGNPFYHGEDDDDLPPAA